MLLNLLFAHCINVKVIFLIGFILKDKGKVKEMATIKHQAARAAFGAAADVTLKYLNKDPEKREESFENCRFNRELRKRSFQTRII